MSAAATNAVRQPLAGSEAELAARWAAGVPGPLRLEDGRALQVVFPGVSGGASGPDFRDAILDAGGDLLYGDVELHLRASGWRSHGHMDDPAYAAVVLHVVAANDGGAPATAHNSGRLIPVLVMPPAPAAFPPPFTPPCALAVARGLLPGETLERLSLRRLRMKAARAMPLIGSDGVEQALYTLLLEQLGGTANRAAFGSIARWLPLATLLERAAARPDGVTRERAIAAELQGAAARLALRRVGQRPMASPARRMDGAAAYITRWFASGRNGWPEALPPPGTVPPRLQVPGVGRGTAIEITMNVVLPMALAAEAWPGEAVEAAWLTMAAPGVYGKLRLLDAWLTGGERPFRTAARLQGGLLLHTDYCTKGMCGRCPLSTRR